MAPEFFPGEEVWDDFPGFVTVTFAPAEDPGVETALVRWWGSGVQTGSLDLPVSGFAATGPDLRATDLLVQYPVPLAWFPLSMVPAQNPAPVVTVSTDGGVNWTTVAPTDYTVNYFTLEFEPSAMPPTGAVICVEFTPADC